MAIAIDQAEAVLQETEAKKIALAILDDLLTDNPTYSYDIANAGKYARQLQRLIKARKNSPDAFKGVLVTIKAMTKSELATLLREREISSDAGEEAGNQSEATSTQEEEQKVMDTLDEIIARGDLAALLKAIPELARLSTAEYMIYEGLAKDAFGSRLNKNDLKKAVNEERDKLSGKGNINSKLDLDYIASVFADRYRDNWQHDSNTQVWKKWTGTHWSEMMNGDDSKSELDLIIVDILHEFGFEVMRTGILDCVQRLIRAKCKRDFKPTPRRVNFLDGTFNIDTDTLDPHDRGDDLFYCLEYPYKSDKGYPTVLAFLSSVLCYPDLDAGGNKVPDWRAIQADMALTGLALIRDRAMHYAEFIKGPPRAGKTTIMRFKNAVWGVINEFAETIEVRYGSFGNDDLFSPELEGKRARYMRNSQLGVNCDELGVNALKDEEMLKNMTGHSGVSMRGMLQNDVRNNAWGPKLVMSTNNLPRYKDTSGGVKERLIFIQTPFRLAETDRDPELLSKLLAERSAYAKDCIRLAKEVIKQRRIPKSSAMKQLAGYAEVTGNTLKSFVDDRCVLEKDAMIPKKLLHTAFDLYRDEGGNAKDYSIQTYRLMTSDTYMGRE